MLEGLKQNPTLLNYRKQYEMLSTRDRLALKIMAAVLIAVLIYSMLWLPAQKFMHSAEVKLAQNKQLLSLVTKNSSTLASLAQQSRAGGAARTLDSQQLVSSVTNLARQKGVVLKRFEPSGENKLKVWVDDASFDKVITWLSALKKTLKVTVEQISIEKDDAPGQISARLTLSS
jgi:general secretion pathway protein M